MEDAPALLDNLTADRLAELDPHGMLQLVRGFPRQCAEARRVPWRRPAGWAPRVRQVLVTGLGGSAVGGDLAKALVDDAGKTPLAVNRDYTLPAWVDPETLVVAVSYSGNTEETLAAFQDAVGRGAPIAVVTSGGQLLGMAQQQGAPSASPPGGQPPRSATGYLFFPLLQLLMDQGVVPGSMDDDAAEAVSVLETMEARLGPDVPYHGNPAKQLAARLVGTVPVIYGSQGYRGVAAYRWKSQINENAKAAGFSNVLPEQNHNEILAWEMATRQAPSWFVVFLRDPAEKTVERRVARRVEVARDLLGVESAEVWAEGRSLLARMLSLFHVADYVSTYLAFLYGVCPTRIAGIDALKAELAKLQDG